MALATGWAALSTGLVRGLEIHDNFFHRQVCCRCRETIQKTVKNGRHWLRGYSSRLSEIHDEG